MGTDWIILPANFGKIGQSGPSEYICSILFIQTVHYYLLNENKIVKGLSGLRWNLTECYSIGESTVQTV